MDITSVLLFLAFTGISLYQNQIEQKQYHHECNEISWESIEQRKQLDHEIARIQQAERTRSWTLSECANLPAHASCFSTRQCFAFETRTQAFKLERTIQKQSDNIPKKIIRYTQSSHKKKYR